MSSPYGNPPVNPDQRQLPGGWITQYDTRYSAWYYVYTREVPPRSSWIHPLDITPPAGPPPRPSGHSYQPPPVSPPARADTYGGYGRPAPAGGNYAQAPASTGGNYNQPQSTGGGYRSQPPPSQGSWVAPSQPQQQQYQYGQPPGQYGAPAQGGPGYGNPGQQYGQPYGQPQGWGGAPAGGYVQPQQQQQQVWDQSRGQWGAGPQQPAYSPAAPKKSGMGVGTMVAAGGAGLLGGVLLSEVIENHDENERMEGYQEGYNDGADGGGEDW